MHTEREFRQAAEVGDCVRMQEILDQDDSILGFENPDNLPLKRLSQVQRLQTACREGNLSVVRALLDATPDLINSQWTEQRWFPLSQAVAAGQFEVVDLLVERGADLNQRYENGGSVLHIAVWSGAVAMVEKVLSLGVPLNITDDDGQTPLALAIESHRNGLIQFLEQRGGEKVD